MVRTTTEVGRVHPYLGRGGSITYATHHWHLMKPIIVADAVFVEARTRLRYSATQDPVGR